MNELVIRNRFRDALVSGRYPSIPDDEFRNLVGELLVSDDLSGMRKELCCIYYDASVRGMDSLALSVLREMEGKRILDDWSLRCMISSCIYSSCENGIIRLLNITNDTKVIASEIYFISRTVSLIEVIESNGVVLSILGKDDAGKLVTGCRCDVLKYLLERKLISADAIKEAIGLKGKVWTTTGESERVITLLEERTKEEV